MFYFHFVINDWYVMILFRGETAFPSAHNVMYGSDGKCSEGAVDRMVADLEKQYESFLSFY